MHWLYKAWKWFDDRTELSNAVEHTLKHRVPPGTDWRYVFGSAALVAFIVQVVTGTALATVYVTAAGSAYHALDFITHQAAFGRVLRGMHYFGASAMILFAGIHMIRTYLTGSYKFPREMNWICGVILLGLTLLMGFTGQLLRWDQNGVWSTVVAAEQAGRVPVIGHLLARFILGGQTVGGATLSRFFAYHVFFVPALIFAFIGLHLLLVLRQGISEPPKAGRPVDPKHYRNWYKQYVEKYGHPFWPDDAWRDVTFAFLMVCAIVALAYWKGPPELTRPPDPTIIEAYPRPDWYLLWYFAVLAQLPHGTEPIVIVGAPIAAGLILLAIPFLSNKGERSPNRRPWAIAFVVLTAMMVATLWVEGLKSPWSPDFHAQPLPAHVVGQASAEVQLGATLFHDKGCEYCHKIAGHGGSRGPDLTYAADRLTREDMIIRIMNGGTNMPAFAGSLKPAEADALISFLRTRTAFPASGGPGMVNRARP